MTLTYYASITIVLIYDFSYFNNIYPCCILNASEQLLLLDIWRYINKGYYLLLF